LRFCASAAAKQLIRRRLKLRSEEKKLSSVASHFSPVVSEIASGASVLGCDAKIIAEARSEERTRGMPVARYTGSLNDRPIPPAEAGGYFLKSATRASPPP
jgi:hypothetical protein